MRTGVDITGVVIDGVMSGDLAAYRQSARSRVELLNHALEGIPAAKIRYHLCWGSWCGPHSTDLPLADIVDLLLKLEALAKGARIASDRLW